MHDGGLIIMNSIDYLVKSAIIKVPHTKGMGEGDCCQLSC